MLDLARPDGFAAGAVDDEVAVALDFVVDAAAECEEGGCVAAPDVEAAEEVGGSCG